MSLPYKNFLQELCVRTGFSMEEASIFMNKFVEIVHREIQLNGEINIPYIGKFEKFTSKARMGRNPNTGEDLMLPPKTTVKFRISKNFKNVAQR